MTPKANKIIITIGVVMLALMYLGDFILNTLISFGVTNDDDQGVRIYRLISVAFKSVGWLALLFFLLGSVDVCGECSCIRTATANVNVPLNLPGQRDD